MLPEAGSLRELKELRRDKALNKYIENSAGMPCHARCNGATRFHLVQLAPKRGERASQLAVRVLPPNISCWR